MDIVIYGGARASGKAVGGRTKSQPRRSLFERLLDALAMTRIQQASRMIELYAHLLAPDSVALAFDEDEREKPR